MKKLSRLLGVACFGVLVLPLLFVQAQPRELPGKPITELTNKWRKDIWDQKVETRRKAMDGYLRLSGEMPRLVFSLIKGLQDEDAEVRFSAAKGLVHVGQSGWLAVDDLVDVLQNDKDARVRREAAAALGKIFWDGSNPTPAKKGIPALIRAMKNDQDTHVRWTACNMFRSIGRMAKDAAPDLLEAMKERGDDQFLFYARGSFVAVVGPDCHKLTPPLLKMFKGGIDDYYTEFVVLEALGKIGAKEDVVVPLLIDALKGKGVKNIRCRGAAAYALGEMGPKAKSALPFLIEALHDSAKLAFEDPRNIWSYVFDGLEGIGESARVALPTIRRIEADATVDRRIRERAKESLERFEEMRSK